MCQSAPPMNLRMSAAVSLDGHLRSGQPEARDRRAGPGGERAAIAGQMRGTLGACRKQFFRSLVGAGPQYNFSVMSCGSLSVRVVLTWCLMLNTGTGVRADVGHLNAPNAAQASAAQALPVARGGLNAPCHGTPSAIGEPHPTTNPHAASTETGDQLPYCCRHTACMGTCLQHAPAAMAFWIPAAVITRTAAAAPMSIPHAAPELPPLTRPPIV
jgi:hypothetical protein